MVASYHVTDVIGSNVAGEIVDALDALAREGARQMLEKALMNEVAEHLGRDPWERSGDFRGNRNGRGRKRTIAIGTWAVPVQPPRVSDVPEGLPRFRSKVLPPRTRMSMETQRLFARLYLEGLSTGDFAPVFRQLLGETAPLSPNTIVRLKEEWAEEYKAWKARSLKDDYFVYVWMDGIYIGAGIEKEQSCLLTLVGARSDGTQELITMELGYRESEASWGEVFRGLRGRGMRCPVLFIGDGNLGAWKGLDDVYPDARRQRCLNHHATNVLDNLPKRMEAEAQAKLGQLYNAMTRAESKGSEMKWSIGFGGSGRSQPQTPCFAIGTTSSPSTTSLPTTGSTSRPPTRSSRCSPVCGFAPTLRNGCGIERTRSTWSTRSCDGSASAGAHLTVARTSWRWLSPARSSRTASCRGRNQRWR